jgi:fucose 4-O-acetylase-like acetyltransferase
MNENRMENRDIYLDNAKALLMLLVVVGHMVAPVREGSNLSKSLYVFIYSFHMPMFALLSGYFASVDMSLRSFRKSVLQLLPPYLIFQSILILLEGSYHSGESANLSLLEPFNAMWYLVSLLTWRALLPLFSKFRYGILAALFLALLCGYFWRINRYLSLSRTFVLFPCFLSGFYLKEKGLRKWFSIMPKSIGAALLVLCCLLAFYFRDVELGWLWHADGYEASGCQGWLGPCFRFLTLLIATLLGLAFFSVVPEDEMAVSRIGRQTLYVYLLHFLTIRILFHLGFYSKMTGSLALVVLVPLGILMGFFLSDYRVTKLTAPFVDPISCLKKLRQK